MQKRRQARQKKNKKQGKGGKNLHTRYQFVRGTMDPTRKRLTLARLLLSGAWRQSKIINTPNFEKWLKKSPPPLVTRFQLRLIKINTSIKCEYAKPGGGRRAYALMVFQTTRSIINIWRLGKCIRSLPHPPPPARPFHWPPAVLAVRRNNARMTHCFILCGTACVGGRGRRRDLDLCAIVCSIEIMPFHAYAFPNRISDVAECVWPAPCLGEGQREEAAARQSNLM